MGAGLLRTVQISIAMLCAALAVIGIGYIIGLIETEQAIGIAVRTAQIIGICLVALIALFAVFSAGRKGKDGVGAERDPRR